MRLIITGFICLIFFACTMTPNGIWHTVEEGQTLYRISHEYEIDEIYLARINGINDPKRLQPGERVFIPGRTVAKNVPATALRTTTSHKSPSFSPTHQSSRIMPDKSKVARSAPGKFSWPLQGKVIRKFSANGKAPSKGIEIAVATETPVLAAASGRVIYSGDGIKGFGNLIIIKHGGTFYSVYGFNRKNLVQVATMVDRGERIALSGGAPGGGEPRLHFEIRKGKKAVNPEPYLP